MGRHLTLPQICGKIAWFFGDSTPPNLSARQFWQETKQRNSITPVDAAVRTSHFRFHQLPLLKLHHEEWIEEHGTTCSKVENGWCFDRKQPNVMFWVCYRSSEEIIIIRCATFCNLCAQRRIIVKTRQITDCIFPDRVHHSSGTQQILPEQKQQKPQAANTKQQQRRDGKKETWQSSQQQQQPQ